MRDLAELFWENVERYQRLKGLRNCDLAKLLGQPRTHFNTRKAKRLGFNSTSLSRMAEALDVLPQDLLDDWTDEEWQRSTGR